MTNLSLRRDFTDRDDLVAYLREQFPQAAAIDDHVAETRGGRAAAVERLKLIDPEKYGATRNQMDGAVTKLSPYLRYGVLGLAEVRDEVLRRVEKPNRAYKLVNELSWRDYYQRAYRVLGDDIWENMEGYKTGLAHADYADKLPEDLLRGETGIASIDAWVQDLVETGYVHNHARMWLAGYVVHWRRVKWQVGARWFLTHLLDGDPASNNLSWQWVASTFSHKAYIFNQSNIDKYTKGMYHVDDGPFNGTYKEIADKLFPAQRWDRGAESALLQRLESVPAQQKSLGGVDSDALNQPTVVWLHGDNLNLHGPALAHYPDAPAVWVWDDALLDQWQISLKRILFIYECLLDLPVEIRRGDVADEVLRFARKHNAEHVAVAESPSPRFREIGREIQESLSVSVFAEEPFVEYEGKLDLRRHSRYWKATKKQAFGE